ncbi:MAG: type II toxin-antitoxin system HicA family toxin [Candidatus Gracilibacteria bacterium]
MAFNSQKPPQTGFSVFDPRRQRETFDSPAAAARRLYLANKAASFPNSLRKTIGEDNVRFIQKLVESPDMLELDMLYMSGVISEHEFTDYIKSLPQYAIIRRQIMVVAQNIGNHMVEQFPEAVHDMRSYHAFVRKVHEFLNKFELQNTPTFRNACFNSLSHVVAQYLFVQVTAFFQRTGRPEVMKDIVSHHQQFHNHNTDSQEFTIDAATLYDDMAKVSEFFDALIDPDPISHVDNDDIDIFDLIMDEVIELSCTNLVEEDIFEYQGFRMTIIPSDAKDDSFSTLCQVGISPPGQDGWCMASFDRSTGDIFFKNTFIPMNVVIPHDLYFALQSAFADRLLQQLRSTEAMRVSSLPQLSHQEMVDADQRIDAAFAQVQVEDMCEATHGAVEKFVWRRPEAEVSPAAQVSTTPSSSSKPLDQNAKSIHRVLLIARLPSKKAIDIIAAFTRLIGKPSRINGSHHMFVRDGVSYPIPFHPGEPISTGIILRGMRVFGISEEQMLAVL